MGLGNDLNINVDLFTHHKDFVFPEPIKPGDKIALISPASVVNEEYVYSAIDRLMQRGYEPVLMPAAIGKESGSFAATKDERLIDLLDALQDPEIKAILCTRGGYGCAQLLSNISYNIVANNPKWLIGFSDVSALLAMFYRSKIASIHGPMAKHLTTMPEDDPSTQALFQLLENGGKFEYTVPSHKYNLPGEAIGILRGGNLAVLNDLANTPYDLLSIKDGEDVILFLEDISEPIYKVNRMLYRLLINGDLNNVKGLILGQFTEYKPDKNFRTMEDMINDFLKTALCQNPIPVVYKFPTGHTDYNLPLVEGARISLSVSENNVRIKTL